MARRIRELIEKEVTDEMLLIVGDPSTVEDDGQTTYEDVREYFTADIRATANNAVSTANTANQNASSALTTANSARETANNAVTTASQANDNATSALAKANDAQEMASNALTTASQALANVNAALAGKKDNKFGYAYFTATPAGTTAWHKVCDIAFASPQNDNINVTLEFKRLNFGATTPNLICRVSCNPRSDNGVVNASSLAPFVEPSIPATYTSQTLQGVVNQMLACFKAVANGQQVSLWCKPINTDTAYEGWYYEISDNAVRRTAGTGVQVNDLITMYANVGVAGSAEPSGTNGNAFAVLDKVTQEILNIATDTTIGSTRSEYWVTNGRTLSSVMPAIGNSAIISVGGNNINSYFGGYWPTEIGTVTFVIHRLTATVYQFIMYSIWSTNKIYAGRFTEANVLPTNVFVYDQKTAKTRYWNTAGQSLATVCPNSGDSAIVYIDGSAVANYYGGYTTASVKAVITRINATFYDSFVWNGLGATGGSFFRTDNTTNVIESRSDFRPDTYGNGQAITNTTALGTYLPTNGRSMTGSVAYQQWYNAIGWAVSSIFAAGDAQITITRIAANNYDFTLRTRRNNSGYIAVMEATGKIEGNTFASANINASRISVNFPDGLFIQTLAANTDPSTWGLQMGNTLAFSSDNVSVLSSQARGSFSGQVSRTGAGYIMVGMTIGASMLGGSCVLSATWSGSSWSLNSLVPAD